MALFRVGAIAGIVASYGRNLPDISRMADYQPARSTRIFARDGSQLASVYSENRVWVPIGHIPPVVRNAFIANEDHNFYHHHGVDFGGIVRAAFADVTHQQFQGASTITQQLARRLFLNDQVSLSRKMQEALLAIEIERYYTKDEILERYLNIIYLGAGAYGVDAAAHTYFGRGVDKLTIAQAAMLAGVVAAPSDYSPFANLPLARDRERHVLDRMVESGYITSAQADAAYEGPLDLIAPRLTGLQGYRYPYFTTYAIARLEQIFGRNAVEEGGLQVYTTLDQRMQDMAQEAVTWGVNQAVAEGIGAHQAALVALRPSTGEILAMVGGTGFSLHNQFNRAWQAHRQPGSSFKVYDYTAAIDTGMTAATIIDDTPVTYPMGDGTHWSPMDDDNRYMGAITLREALTHVAQCRRGEDRRARRHRPGHRLRASHGRDGAAGGESFARARIFGRFRSIRRPAMRRSPTKGCTSIRRRFARQRFARQRRARQSRPAGERRRQRRHRVHRDVDARRRHHARHRVSERRHRPAGGRQDRNDFELPRCLVRRIHAGFGHRRLARQRRLHTDE